MVVKAISGVFLLCILTSTFGYEWISYDGTEPPEDADLSQGYFDIVFGRSQVSSEEYVAVSIYKDNYAGPFYGVLPNETVVNVDVNDLEILVKEEGDNFYLTINTAEAIKELIEERVFITLCSGTQGDGSTFIGLEPTEKGRVEVTILPPPYTKALWVERTTSTAESSDPDEKYFSVLTVEQKEV